MNERNSRTRDVVETTSYLLSGNRRSRTGRVAGAVLGKVIEQESGKVTGRVVVVLLVVLAVVGWPSSPTVCSSRWPRPSSPSAAT